VGQVTGTHICGTGAGTRRDMRAGRARAELAAAGAGRGVTRGARGNNAPGAESLGGAEKSKQRCITFFDTVHLLPNKLFALHLASCTKVMFDMCSITTIDMFHANMIVTGALLNACIVKTLVIFPRKQRLLSYG